MIVPVITGVWFSVWFLAGGAVLSCVRQQWETAVVLCVCTTLAGVSVMLLDARLLFFAPG